MREPPPEEDENRGQGAEEDRSASTEVQPQTVAGGSQGRKATGGGGRRKEEKPPRVAPDVGRGRRAAAGRAARESSGTRPLEAAVVKWAARDTGDSCGKRKSRGTAEIQQSTAGGVCEGARHEGRPRG